MIRKLTNDFLVMEKGNFQFAKRCIPVPKRRQEIMQIKIMIFLKLKKICRF